VLAVVIGSTLVGASVADAARYIVLFHGKSVPRSAEKAIAKAGGTLIYSYDQIGVAIVDSDNPAFLEQLDNRHGVSSALLGDDDDDFDDADVQNRHEPRRGRLPNVPATDGDTFSPFQWDLRQTGVTDAHAITGGSPAVLVGDLDSGVDYQHPDLRENLDLADSASCLGGVPNQAPDPITGRLPFDDTLGHGTHTAGTIAAADNGLGTVGVAPNVRLASVKVADSAGKIFPEAAICGFMWAATHGFDVTNNSYSVDKHVLDPARPERNGFYCRDDRGERVVIAALQRAVSYARHRGVTVVASAGNNNTDLANPPAGNRCLRLPVELRGVVGVSSESPIRQMTFNSNYGLGVVDLTAPGGDPLQPALPPAVPMATGQVLSTWPTSMAAAPGVRLDQGAPYRNMFGTSSAAAHVSGVAALLISRYGDNSPWNGRMRPRKVEALLEFSANPIACPPNPYVRVIPVPPPVGGTFTANCFGWDRFNGFFGHVEVDALGAVGG
jgi:lantibiotic leader peptide-processing serine protease